MGKHDHFTARCNLSNSSRSCGKCMSSRSCCCGWGKLPMLVERSLKYDAFAATQIKRKVITLPT